MLVVFFRAIILYILITFCIRLMGKRQLGELQPSELVITILISNIASLPIEDTSIPMILGIIPVFVLVACELFVSNIALQFKGFRSFISGKPVIVIYDGIIDQKQLRKLRFSIDDLMASLRQNNIFDISEVMYAVVETTGKVSVLQKFPYQNATPKILKIKGESEEPPAVIISDGKILKSALKKFSIEEDFVLRSLKKEGVSEKEVFLMTCDSKKHYRIIKKEKKKWREQ